MKKSTNNKGISPVAVVIIIVLIIAIGGGFWYFLIRKENVNTNSVNITPAANTNTSLDTTDWQTFQNNTYGYQLKFPKDWYYIADAMTGPLPPATAFFSSVDAVATYKYASLAILVSSLMDESLDTWSEVELLVADGYSKKSIKVGGEDGFRLERSTHPADNGAIIYTAKGDYMFRLSWGATDQSLWPANEAILEAIINSFEFIDILEKDFTKEGNITIYLGDTETENWQLVYEEAGNPALSVDLLFDYHYIPSVCVIDEEETTCQEAIDEGLIESGDRVTVEGVGFENDQVIVFKITK